MSDETATKHMGDAVREIIDANCGGHGDYLIVCQATNDGEGLIFTWQWAWSPKAPEHTGRA